MTSEKFLYPLSELGAEHNDLVGKKCANLGELARAGLPVPAGFALSLDAYEEFLEGTGVRGEMARCAAGFSAPANDRRRFEELSNTLREIMEAKGLPPSVDEPVRRAYEEMCAATGTPDLAVATRSAGTVSRPGQYESYLYVRGADDVAKHVVKVWSSTLNTRSLMWRHENGLPLEYDPIGVAVLQMVHATRSGVMLTLNPLTCDRSKAVINAMYGLGESVVSGEVDPDFFMVDKISREIVQRTVANKERMIQPKPDGRGTEFVPVPDELRTVPCLSDDEIRELVALGRQTEIHFKCPQDIEWAIEGGSNGTRRIFLVQARPEKSWEKHKSTATVGLVDSIAEMMVKMALRDSTPASAGSPPPQSQS